MHVKRRHQSKRGPPLAEEATVDQSQTEWSKNRMASREIAEARHDEAQSPGDRGFQEARLLQTMVRMAVGAGSASVEHRPAERVLL